jgi:dTDP-4-dehydrorhamnose reductase
MKTAERPRNSRLSPEKLAATFGVRLPEWHNGLELVFETIQNGIGSWR